MFLSNIFKRNAITFEEALSRDKSNSRQGIQKHLLLCFGKIPTWRELDRANLNKFKEYLLANLCRTTTSGYMGRLRSIIGKWDNHPRAKDYKAILTIKPERSTKVFLTIDELKRLEEVIPKNETERLVKAQFLIGAYTGCRLSDMQLLDSDNVAASGYIEYTSKKTSTTARVPASEKVIEYIKECEEILKIRAEDTNRQKNKGNVSECIFNRTIKRMVREAGAVERVKLFNAGKNVAGEKWEFVSSHTARISFATNLSILKVPLLDIMRLMGHKEPQMTMRYCLNQTVELNEEARKYFE